MKSVKNSTLYATHSTVHNPQKSSPGVKISFYLPSINDVVFPCVSIVHSFRKSWNYSLQAARIANICMHQFACKIVTKKKIIIKKRRKTEPKFQLMLLRSIIKRKTLRTFDRGGNCARPNGDASRLKLITCVFLHLCWCTKVAHEFNTKMADASKVI